MNLSLFLLLVEQKCPENFDYLRSETLEISIRKRHHLVHAIMQVKGTCLSLLALSLELCTHFACL